ncbi:uncharacterized protein KNAG_0D03800 [Huiozyma naganishii CBS 8797]|uniref:Pyridoxamine 5'-phosphate oxidase Alr4036 family FMN-binding domain-containing protein n=1 Tax=Huiozyma naganishii (strain ATCC MYA-139 / BCRC 22969 / CBS 8797 / KCTC 17520 / NBRC 10181 / NCYC 3082 / Yp74L-3) TaxID=1071383 RepID=J7S758_HUIN7|nr:hypothetical protein KNAG_0D03800 [Kazachstania naganishii CBS 8797]CCK70126.1 hypothetical protein KNAG_0D03800 [Kazachstania naganishii CBS 8797]
MSLQMAPWVPIFRQSCKNTLNEKSPIITFQFATVDVNQEEKEDVEIGESIPRVRSVVLRGFLFDERKLNVLCFNTDLRSDKMRGLNASKRFEACFYFPQTWEQFRFSGKCFVISLNGVGGKGPKHQMLAKYRILLEEEMKDHDEHLTYKFPTQKDWDEEVLRQWNTLSRSAKSLYRKPPPGQLLTSETSEKLDKIQRGVDGAKEDVGLDNFAVVCLCVDQVDYLNLKDGRGGERRLYKRVLETAHSCENEEHLQQLRDEANDNDDYHDLVNGHEIWHEIEVCP